MKSLRQAFGDALVEVGHKHPNVVAVSCDLKVATKSDGFFKTFPERSYEVGIAEANGIGIAAGLALGGYRPFISSFGAFITGKNVEIRTSIAYNNAPVVIVGTHGGMIGKDGATQASIQDISVMRSIPGMKVLQPSTPLECRYMIHWAASNKEMVYIRVARNEAPELYQAVNSLQPHIIHQGLYEYPRMLISSGPMLHNCIAAAKLFNDVNVMSVPMIEPIDGEYIRRWGLMTDKMIVVEDHTTRGGLGGAVAECHPACDLELVGIDSFVPSGTPKELEEYFGLDVKGIECLLSS